jgi:hypothetical protein
MRVCHLLGQELKPPTEREELTAHHQWFCLLFKQLRGPLPILRNNSMLQRLCQEAVLFKPASGPAVDVGYNLLVRTIGQTLTQDLREEMMVAIPAPRLVQRDEEEVAALQFLQQQLTIGMSCLVHWEVRP